MSITTAPSAVGDVVRVLSADGATKRVLAWTNGGAFGTASTDLIGFYGDTPVDQPAAVANATDAASAITQLNALLARVRELGLIDT